MNKERVFDICIILTIIAAISIGVHLYTKERAEERWCNDKGGVYIDLVCIDKSSVIELESEVNK